MRSALSVVMGFSGYRKYGDARAIMHFKLFLRMLWLKHAIRNHESPLQGRCVMASVYAPNSGFYL